MRHTHDDDRNGHRHASEDCASDREDDVRCQFPLVVLPRRDQHDESTDGDNHSAVYRVVGSLRMELVSRSASELRCESGSFEDWPVCSLEGSSSSSISVLSAIANARI